MTPLESEIVKIALNGYITTKISYANMISDLCDTMGANKYTVLNAIGNDKRIGNKYFNPGYSFGGPCFPRDTKALNKIISQKSINSDLLSATTKYNEYHVLFQTEQLLKQNKKSYIFENVCYKKNSMVPIIKESAKLKIAKELNKRGKKVIIRDTKEIINEVKKEFGIIFIYEIKTETKNLISEKKSDEKLMNDVYEFWNNRPCNIKHSNKKIGSKEYFEEVTKRKYIVEPHILTFADFEKYNGKNILEVGCGIGTAAQSFIENGANYTGIDLSDVSVELTKKRLQVFNLKGNIFQANIENTINCLKDKQFDLVYSFGVLHHTPNVKIAIDNIWKILKPEGEFKLMMYAKNSLKYFEITEGLDQYEAQSGVPVANVYTNDDIYVLLNKFKNIQIKQEHIFPYKIKEYKNYKYEKKECYKYMPEKTFKMLENKLGWHLCITCTK